MNKPVTLLRNATGRGTQIHATGLIRKGQAFKSPPQPNKRTGNACLLGESRAGPRIVRLVVEARRYARRVVLEPTPKLRRGDARESVPREGMASQLRRHPKVGSDALRWLRRSCVSGQECPWIIPRLSCPMPSTLGSPKVMFIYKR